MIHFIKAIILPSYVSVSGQKYIYKVGAEIQTHTRVSSYDEEVHVIIWACKKAPTHDKRSVG